MSDINNVLSTLCKYINSLIDITLNPECLRLAKYNSPDQNTAQLLWSMLHMLSCYAARQKQSDLDFQNYDILTAVKLYLAFLQYPVIEFYGLSENSHCNRDLLIAIAWLLQTENVLTTIFRVKLANSPLGAEFSHYVPTSKSVLATCNNEPLSTYAQICNILHLNGKVNLNLKEISELMSERCKLISKVHVASIGISGLPHLSVSELALTKRIVTADRNTYSEQDGKYLLELQNAGVLLNIRAKWLETRYIFFDWMTTVIREHRKLMESNLRMINSRQLSVFISLLHHIIKEKLEALISVEKSDKFPLICSSRFLRDQCDNNEVEKLLNDLNARQNFEQENIQQSRERLVAEMKGVLKLIPSSVHI